ncbi:uncharacterized protein LOC132553405 [Ylistrum balloti]|uniref:uncharacterized protein LOC132553405 n=1 Tax=Ylistrum balloti TaxID=509963 RepID=UPI0029059DC5|nr:uncharacterized protein LOC132553405 [Ylistrum balloti]
MEDILIPNIPRIARLTRKTIDRFVSLTEAISDTDEGFRCFVNTSMLAVCRTVMMEMATKTLDFDGLFDILEKVTLALVSDGLSCPCRTDELPKLTRLQKEDLLKFETFNKVTVKEMKTKVTLLKHLIKKHKQILAADEIYRQASIKYEKKLTAIMYRLHGPSIKPRVMSSIQRKRDQTQKEFTRIRSARLINGGLEKKVKDKIKMTSDDVVSYITNQIVDRLDYGIEHCLYDIIDKIKQEDVKERMIKLTAHMNKNDMADRLVRQCSETYVMRVNVHPEKVNSDLCVTDISSSAESVGESTIVEEIKLDPSTGEINVTLPACSGTSSGEISHDTGYCTGDDWNKYVMGIEIKQTACGDEEDVAFGYYKPNRKAGKQWGFYFVDPTLSLMELFCRGRD